MFVELHLNSEAMQLAQQAAAAFEEMNLGYEIAKAYTWLGMATHQSRKPAKKHSNVLRVPATVWRPRETRYGLRC